LQPLVQQHKRATGEKTRRNGSATMLCRGPSMVVLENSRGSLQLCLVAEREVREGAPLPATWGIYRFELDEVVRWAHRYLCEPHPELGREGPVCPYARTSLERDLFWLALDPAVDAREEDVVAAAREYRRWFGRLEPVAGRGTEYKAIVILFPALPPERAGPLLDSVQATLKPEFVDCGLMISQFHSTCAEVGRWNTQFYPLRSPVPLLTVRAMVRMDTPFLVADPHWLSAYLRSFGDDVPIRFQPMVRRAARTFGIEYAGSS
jgi:hypothetical protein